MSSSTTTSDSGHDRAKDSGNPNAYHDDVEANSDRVVHDYHDRVGEGQGSAIAARDDEGGVHSDAFPVKLHFMLEESERDGLSHIVSWQPHGRCFLVHKKEEFEESILPNYFSQSKFASFQRQLNIYSFKRLSNGVDKGAYYHECFIRYNRPLALQIKRTKIKGRGPRKAASPETEPNFYAMSPIKEPAPAPALRRIPRLPDAAAAAASGSVAAAQQPSATRTLAATVSSSGSSTLENSMLRVPGIARTSPSASAASNVPGMVQSSGSACAAPAAPLVNATDTSSTSTNVPVVGAADALNFSAALTAATVMTRNYAQQQQQQLSYPQAPQAQSQMLNASAVHQQLIAQLGAVGYAAMLGQLAAPSLHPLQPAAPASPAFMIPIGNVSVGIPHDFLRSLILVAPAVTNTSPSTANTWPGGGSASQPPLNSAYSQILSLLHHANTGQDLTAQPPQPQPDNSTTGGV